MAKLTLPVHVASGSSVAIKGRLPRTRGGKVRDLESSDISPVQRLLHDEKVGFIEVRGVDPQQGLRQIHHAVFAKCDDLALVIDYRAPAIDLQGLRETLLERGPGFAVAIMAPDQLVQELWDVSWDLAWNGICFGVFRRENAVGAFTHAIRHSRLEISERAEPRGGEAGEEAADRVGSSGPDFIAKAEVAHG